MFRRLSRNRETLHPIVILSYFTPSPLYKLYKFYFVFTPLRKSKCVIFEHPRFLYCSGLRHLGYYLGRHKYKYARVLSQPWFHVSFLFQTSGFGFTQDRSKARSGNAKQIYCLFKHRLHRFRI